ncbi:MAG: MazG nucleotide pyrophosphohydrolase domain-containing protein [Clostridia bacterium]
MGWVYAAEREGFWVEGPYDPEQLRTATFFPPDAPVLRMDTAGRTTTVRWDAFLDGPALSSGESARLPGDPNGAGPMTYLVGRLRAPDGCPWDREQTPRSLLRYLLDEAYEAAAAIEAEDWDLVLDELGDVLLQVVLQSQIQDETGRFDFNRVAAAQARKLTGRHPHVFAEVRATSSQDVQASWDRLKAQEPHKGHGDERVMPGLMAYSRSLKRGEVSLGPRAAAYLEHLQQDGRQVSREERRRLLVDWLAAGVAAARSWHEEAEWVLWEALPGPRKMA